MRKLTITATALVTMLAVLVSCEKKDTIKETQSSVEKSDMVFTATSENGALKTTILSDGVTAVWSETDNLKVFTAEDTDGSVCGYKSGAGTAIAEFEGQCDSKGPWTAICPAIDGATYSAGTITFTMPETQTYAANTFADGAMPCVAYSTTHEFNFNHSFGVLKLSLKLKEGCNIGSVGSITVTDKGGAKLWGTFTVNPQNSAAATYSTGGTSSVILDCGTGVALSTSKATDFWIVVPEGAFASGFDVTVTYTKDCAFPVNISNNKVNTITAGKVKEMPVKVIKFWVPPTTGDAYAEAVGDNVKWVQLWCGGPKWAEYNVGEDTGSGSYQCGGYFAWKGNQTRGSAQKVDDTATYLWGSNWRMPTSGEFVALNSNCDKAWTTNYNNTGKAGRLYRGRGDFAGNSVFFPAAGYYNSGSVSNAGTQGNYWSSTSGGGSFATISVFEQNFESVRNSLVSYGDCVRAVLAE